MPFIVDEPVWGLNNDYIQHANYNNAILHGEYIDDVKGFKLYQEKSDCIHTYYLVNDIEKKIVYKAKILDEFNNNRYSQNLLWRNQSIDSLKGISAFLINEYYLNIYDILYSDTCQSLAGRKMWINMMYHYDNLEYGYFDYNDNSHSCIDDIESIYHRKGNIDIALYVKR